MEDLRTVLRDVEASQQQTLRALTDSPAQIAHLKDAVLMLLEMLCQSEEEDARHEVMSALHRVFLVCAAHFYDSRAFLDASTETGGVELKDSTLHGLKGGNVVLKALLDTLTTLTSRPSVDHKVVQDVVALVQELFVQSTSATDVVALFDFLRLSAPPARRWILQMQHTLVEMEAVPRAIFTMRGSSAGLLVPSEQPLISKRGYSCSFGLRLDSSAAVVSLYSFRGQNGQGVAAVLEGDTLVVKTYAGQGSVQQLEVPFAEHRDQMEHAWVHLCVVHAKKMVFKDKLAIYVDGKPTFSGNLIYPDPMWMVGGQNSIGIAPLAAGLQGKVWSPTLFGVALSEAEVRRLHWLTHWKNDLSSVAAENAGLTDKSKFVFSYDARSCDLDQRVSYDVSGNDCHGFLEPGTSAFVTHSFVQALDSVGGCACFLLLLLDQIPEMADFHPKVEFGMEEISDLLSFVGAGLHRSIACRSHFVRLQGVKVVEFVLQSISPSYLSVALLGGVVSIVEAMADYLQNDETLAEEYIHRLLFFNTSWFLSPFETQVKLLGEVLPRYLQILLKARQQARTRTPEGGSSASSIGKLVRTGSKSSPDFAEPLESKRQVDVSFFCNLIAQVYVPRASEDSGQVAIGQIDANQLVQLRELIIHKLVDRLLFPPAPDTASDQWRQLLAYIFRQCDRDSGRRSQDGNGADVEEILRYLTQILDAERSGVPTVAALARQQQLTVNLFKFSKGTMRVLWRPMLSAAEGVRLAALQLFEVYTSEKVLLHRSDMLMLHSSLQAHSLSADAADLLLDIIIGRKRSPAGSSKTLETPNTAPMRSGSIARMVFIPWVLLGLVHNAEFDVQVRVLSEIKVQLSSGALGESVKEAIRSWPPWMSRLRSLALAASADARKSSNTDSQETRNTGAAETQALNEACAVLSDDYTPAFAKLEAIRVISDSKDVAGCDFALSLLQSSKQGVVVGSAIVTMVVDHFPQRCSTLVGIIVNQMVVDMVVYSILHVRNGWMHFLEFYFCHFRKPSDLCSLTVAICEQVMQRASQKLSIAQAEVIWENLCQVAAVVSQSQLVASEVSAKMEIDEVVLSPGQERIVMRKAFELWLMVLPHLHQIDWDALTAQLVQNAEYGSDVTQEEIEIFCNLVATRSRARFLALQTAIRHVTSSQPNGANDAVLIQSFHNLLELLNLIPPVSAASMSSDSLPTSSLPGSPPPRVMSPPGSGSALPDMAFGVSTADMTDSTSFLESAVVSGPTLDRELVHMYALDACFVLLDNALSAGSDVETVSLIAQIMISLASASVHLRDPNAPRELTKTLQIMSSTDLAFFSELHQVRELLMLWQLHREIHHSCCDREILQVHVDALNADFNRRWLRIVEHHVLEFNPYLIHQFANAQALALGEELQACEELWKEIVDENDAAVVALAGEVEMADEMRLAELKQVTEKFASSVHKRLIRSSSEGLQESLFGEDELVSGSMKSENKDKSSKASASGRDGVLYKIDSKENGFRMRLRLKKVPEDYRIRNLSCECPGSSAMETESRESGRRMSRRFRGSVESGLADLEHSWRSDAGSDYSDFLADAQMRAAIIRSLSNPEERESAYDGLYDEDDADDDDAALCDTLDDEDSAFEAETTDVLDSPPSHETTEENSYTQCDPVHVDQREEIQAAEASSEETTPYVALSGTPASAAVDIPRSSSSPASPSISVSPPLSASSLGASLLSAVGGFAGYLQNSAKDARDAVEFSVDSLYTTTGAVTEEAQALVQEVSTIMENADGRLNLQHTGSTSSPLSLTSTSLKMMESKGQPPLSSSHGSAAALPVLFPSSPPNDEVYRDTSQNEAVERPQQQMKRPHSFPSTAKAKGNLKVKAKLVRHLHVVEGSLVLAHGLLGFVAERVIDEHEEVIVERTPGVPIDKTWRFLFKRRRWRTDDIAGIYRRRYLLKPTALEIFIHSSRKNYFFNLASDDLALFHEALMAQRPLILKRDPSVRRLRHPSSLFRNSSMSTRWVQHEVSTFEYLMWLNTIAGRTYNDLTQYPVFPWVISDYESSELDLTRRGAFRDLRKPMGALEPTRLKFFIDRYNAFEDPDIPKFMYGTHYSNIGSVLYYLVRLEPFTSYALNVQGGRFDHADRLFDSIPETWHNCLTDYSDLKELTPEWFYLPEFLVNCNKLELGIRQNGRSVNDVILPPWARSPEDFVLKNLVALESEYVSANIHCWIDLVFGCKQRGAAAVAANNVFFYLTYEGMVDVDSITDPVVKSSMQSQIAHFGQTPTQVLRDSHPQRHVLANTVPTDSGESSTKPSPLFPKAELKGTLLSVPHDAPIVLVSMIRGTSSLLCVDSNGMLSSHRFGAKSSGTKGPGTFKPRRSASNLASESSIGASSGGASADLSREFIELQDRKSRKVLGDRRLLSSSSQQSVSSLVAFLNGGMVVCSGGHHDFSARFHSTTDGTLLYRLLQHQSVVTCLSTTTLDTMLALGSADGTLSVWKVAHINSTLLDSLKRFRGAKAGSSKPVHASDYAADQVLLGHTASINCVSLSEELGVSVSGSAANECLAHDLGDGSILQQYAVPGHLAPGVTMLAVSSVGHVVLQSLGTGVPMLHSFHLNGTHLAEVTLEQPMTSLSICARFSKLIVSNSECALMMTAHTLEDQQLLLEKYAYGEISAQTLAPDEVHVVFGVGSGKLVCLPLLPSYSPPHGTEM